MSADDVRPRKILSMDDIRAGLSEMAENGDGAQRAQAYRMLMGMEGTAVTLPEPLTANDIRDRVVRVMRGAGMELVRSCYAIAFPNARAASVAGRSMKYADATPEMIKESRKATGLRILYRLFPETKRHGVPKGFPSGRSLAAKSAWCQDQALKVLVEREMKRRADGHLAMKAADQEIRGATEGSDVSAETEPHQVPHLPTL